MKMTLKDMSQEVLCFDSNTSGWASTMKSGSDQTMNIAQTSDTNDAFLGRPVKILTQIWQVGDNLHFSFNPWLLFFENSKVINRVSHFKNLRATLHVKFQLNGSPFYYGRLMAAYNPLPNTDDFTNVRADVAQDRIAASQRPKIFLDPTTNQGGELICPFIWPKNTLDIPNSEWQKMGNITVFTLNGLGHANDLTDPVTVTAFAYCTDYDLSTPTSKIPLTIRPQMANADEYGVVSGPAHSIANWSGKLSNAPYIGRYARATEMISSTIGNVASLFGFSRPREIAYPKMAAAADVELAITNVPDHSMSLALDAKKEITVDPTVTGAGPEDEMAIVPLACKESYIASFPWSTDEPSDAHLFSIRVRPTQGDLGVVSGLDREVHMTPSSWVSLPFEYWTGSMEFRFQIVCSSFHRGRLRFVWDPDHYVGTDYNVNYSQIVDISNSRDIKLRVGWGANTSYLPVSASIVGGFDQTLFPSFSLSPYLAKEPWGNGTLSVFVVNELTSPAQSGSTIELNVFTNMCDDFELASPTCQYIERFAALDYADDPDRLTLVTAPPPPRNPGGNVTPSVPPLDAPTDDNNNNQAVTGLVVKNVNPFGVLLVDPSVISPGQSRPYASPQYSNQIGVAADRAYLLETGTAKLQLWGRGQPNGFGGFLKFTFNNPSTNVRQISIKNVDTGISYPGTLPGNIGGTVEITIVGNFFGGGNWDQLPIEITVAGSGGRIILERVETSMYTYENVSSYSNVNIDANSPDFTISGNKAVAPAGTTGTIIGPTGATVGNPGSWITTTSGTIDGNNLTTVSAVGDTGAVPAPITWKSVPSGGSVVSGTPTDNADSINVLDFYTVLGTAPQCKFFPEMDGADQVDAEINAPELEMPTHYMGPACVSGPSNQVYFGEQVASWRQLLKRSHRTYTLNGTNVAGPTTLYIPQYPIATSDINVASMNVDYNPYNLYRWVSSAYVCERGSYRVKLLSGHGGAAGPSIGSVSMTRVPNTTGETPRGVSNLSELPIDVSFCGTTWSFTNFHGYSEAEVPWYSNYRFIQSRNSDIRDQANFIERQFVKISMGHGSFVRAAICHSAGEDYSLSNFLCVPVFIYQET